MNLNVDIVELNNTCTGVYIVLKPKLKSHFLGHLCTSGKTE